uniref:Uncharacterized protein n=1 Tax=Eutreptiella gymnastica TaxID=73025 RepID=A0A7S4LJL3_9EUGL
MQTPRLFHVTVHHEPRALAQGVIASTPPWASLVRSSEAHQGPRALRGIRVAQAVAWRRRGTRTRGPSAGPGTTSPPGNSVDLTAKPSARSCSRALASPHTTTTKARLGS